MDSQAGRHVFLGACAWWAAVAGLGVALGAHVLDGVASALVSGWFAASFPFAVLAGGHLSEMGVTVPEGNGSPGGEVSDQEDWGMRSERIPVYTTQSPEAGLLSRMRS